MVMAAGPGGRKLVAGQARPPAVAGETENATVHRLFPPGDPLASGFPSVEQRQ